MSNVHRSVGCAAAGAQKKEQAKKAADSSKKHDLLEDTLKCVICFNLCERPVTVRSSHHLMPSGYPQRGHGLVLTAHAVCSMHHGG